MSGAGIAAEIAAAFNEAAIDAGNGTAAPVATITRIANEQRITAPTTDHPDASAYAPVIIAGSPAVHSFTAKPVSSKAAQKAGMALEDGEKVYDLVNHNVTITPNVSDQVEIDGVPWSVVEVMEKNPIGFVLSWLVRVKR